MITHCVQGIFDVHYVYHVGTFEECATYQHENDMHGYTAVVSI